MVLMKMMFFSSQPVKLASTKRPRVRVVASTWDTTMIQFMGNARDSFGLDASGTGTGSSTLKSATPPVTASTVSTSFSLMHTSADAMMLKTWCNDILFVVITLMVILSKMILWPMKWRTTSRTLLLVSEDTINSNRLFFLQYILFLILKVT